MDLNPTPEQKMLRDAAQKYFRAEYRFDARAKRLASADDAVAGAAHWTRFAEFGWLGLGLPEAVGGFGGMPELIAVCEAMGAALSLEPYVASTVLAAQAVAAAADAGQQLALLTPLVEGRSRLALACTEADSGPTLAWVESRAKRQGSGWVLDGRKTGVVGLPQADMAIVSGSASLAPSASCVSNFRPNWTDGSKKVVIASKGTSSRSGTPETESPTSKECSEMFSSQNWCWSTIVISSGCFSRRRWERRTPGAPVRKVM